MLFSRLSAIVALTPILFATASAQDYPTKPIRYIVATAPGGLMDVPARLLADYFERRYGHRLVIENRGGGGGVMAGDALAKAAPDGYTLLQIQVGNVAINPFTVKDMRMISEDSLLTMRRVFLSHSVGTVTLPV